MILNVAGSNPVTRPFLNMGSQGLIVLTVPVGIGLYYAFSEAFFTLNKELLPPTDYNDLVFCIHHVYI